MASKVLTPFETRGNKDRAALLQTSCQPYYAGFRIIARLHRLGGCCFVDNTTSIHYKDVRSGRFSLYLIYPPLYMGVPFVKTAEGRPLSLLIFAVRLNVTLNATIDSCCLQTYILSGCAVVVVAFALDAHQHNYVVRGAYRLNKNIFQTAVLALILEAVLNFVLLMSRAPQLVELLRITGLMERENNIPLYVQTRTIRLAWSLAMFQVCLIVFNIGLNIYSDFGTAVLLEEGRKLTPYMSRLAMSFGIIGVPFLCFMCTSTRLLLTYTSRVVAIYLGCICRGLDHSLCSRSTPKSRKVVLVDNFRVQISLLKDCVALMSEMLGPSLIYAYAYSVALLCTAAYYTITPELEFRARLFFLFFGILHWLSILLPAATVHNMKLAIRMFLRSIKPDDFRVTGCGFFDVDLVTFADYYAGSDRRVDNASWDLLMRAPIGAIFCRSVAMLY
ncbi:hypothetical protein MRX96_017326 [Rhipicephalus microplus]